MKMVMGEMFALLVLYLIVDSASSAALKFPNAVVSSDQFDYRRPSDTGRGADSEVSGIDVGVSHREEETTMELTGAAGNGLLQPSVESNRNQAIIQDLFPDKPTQPRIPSETLIDLQPLRDLPLVPTASRTKGSNTPSQYGGPVDKQSGTRVVPTAAKFSTVAQNSVVTVEKAPPQTGAKESVVPSGYRVTNKSVDDWKDPTRKGGSPLNYGVPGYGTNNNGEGSSKLKSPYSKWWLWSNARYG